MKKHFIYIAGLYHSGSTLIDHYLGSHSEIAGLGEIYKFIIDGPEDYCSCGKSPIDCEFWKKIINNESFHDKKSSQIDKKYKLIIDESKMFFDNKKYIIDGSKCHPIGERPSYNNFKGLKFYTINYPTTLKVIHLYRDPRSWVSSILRREKRSKRKYIPSLIMSSFIGKTLRYIQWDLMHKRIRHYIKENNLDCLTISYEELCLNTENTIERIELFLDTKIDQQKLSLSESGSHICVGNPSRKRNSKSQKINYDYRWLKENTSLIDTIFSILYWKKIKKFVYGNY